MVEADGKIYVAKDEPDPVRCPECHKLQAPQKGKKFRCKNCRWLGAQDEFKGHFIEIGTARILIAV